MTAAIDRVLTAYQDHSHGASPDNGGTGITVGWTADDAQSGATAAHGSTTAFNCRLDEAGFEDAAELIHRGDDIAGWPRQLAGIALR